MGLAGGKRRLHITRMRGVFKYLCLHLFFFFVLHHWKETMDFYRALNLDHYNIYMVPLDGSGPEYSTMDKKRQRNGGTSWD